MCADLQVTGTPFERQKAEKLAISQGRTDAKKLTDTQLQEFLSTKKVEELDETNPTASTKPTQPQAPVKGAELERTTPQTQDRAPKSTSTITTKLPAALYQDGKIPPQLAEALANVASIGQDGTVTLKAGVTEDSFKQALQKYLNGEATSAQLPAEVTFPEGTDDKWKQHLVDEGALREVTTGEGESATKSYTVADTAKLDSLTTRIDNESGTTRSTQDLDLEFTTTTTTEADNVVAPKGLAHSRKARRALREEYETRLKEWAQENPEIRDEALANMKYGKQVDKRMAKLTSGKKGLQTPTEIAKKYFDSYATQEEKATLATFKQTIADLKPEELADLYNDMATAYNAQKGGKEVALPQMTAADFTVVKGDEYSQAKVNQNIEAITPLVFANGLGETSQSLLRKMAIHDVLADRTKGLDAAQAQEVLASDEKYFIKHMAKREVQAKVNEQNVENTTAHWDKAGKKAAEGAETDSDAIHTDIGKNGRKLVQAYPDQFGARIEDNGHLKEGVDYDYKDTVTDPITKKTVTAYFKFDSEAWDAYWDMAADTRENTLQYAKDNHLTLNEARDRMLTKNGGFNANARRLSAEDALGNGNGRTGVKELKKYRKLAKTTGRTVDVDRTNIQRAGHVVGSAVKNAAMSFVTAGLGDLLSQYATILLQIGGETYNIKGTGTGTYTVNETQWVKTTDHYIDKWGTTDVTHETPVNFHKEGTVTVETSTDFTTPEEQRAVKPDNRTLKVAGGAAAVGGALGLLHGLATVSKQGQDQGTYWDGVVNLDKAPTETTTTSQGKVQMVTERPYEVRQGEYSTEKEVSKYKAVTYRGPEAYSGMYRTANGKPVNPRLFAQAYKKATGVNTMTKSFFYAIPELEINGVKFVLKDNADEEYKKIKVGVRGTVRDRAINTPKTGEVHRGKIRRG